MSFVTFYKLFVMALNWHTLILQTHYLLIVNAIDFYLLNQNCLSLNHLIRKWVNLEKGVGAQYESGTILAAERGLVSKILPPGPRAKSQGLRGRILLAQSLALLLGSSFLFLQQNAGALPFLINIVSSSNSKDTSHLNNCSIRPY